jgi:hypothetical protein
LQRRALVQLWVGGFIAAESVVPFKLGGMSSDSMTGRATKAYERIFASYAREDKAYVESFDSMLRALGIGELRWDLKVLSAGLDWAQALRSEIRDADSFQLFWSEHAKASRNVKDEWRYALGLGRERFIKPVYWADPMPRAPRPLKHLNFSRVVFPRYRSGSSQ